ncbi:translation initiation factor [Synechococcus elongatus]|uniref:Translation initiation factor 1 (eIF-1/SUI1) n=1 Tax=Synechococcus elongatus (strain ATCC 33912 / PCC 7942 / FACHB-805) TaxID=1140 RepID=Q31L97_SYNE7|nr:translation initiation factor [Synechococcus elongatus]ABB58172.1 translation initiation factor 1 (eIF-1/SUI1) [Synechococcus elongatus PCC 7942 = FACHB-805]AJD57351.1 translation initiation factor SUI1 [Synechococcus elongatus UTEX 2973]MBD2586895.1 translation initiation factor [Synechococcus elongatus FACHB-242]MBD2687966.1 translation initiation factor [Synechococcus elongatus FACHB-1061]MBD2706323.1 translation initiation factor [Synechococcus elongatus PCC 7942 = FACHB-805]
MAQKKNSDRIVWREFGSQDAALERGQPDRPPAQHDLRIQCSRKGRGGKTVTIITGFQHRPETLASLCKKLKARCGSGGTVKDDTIEIQGDHRQTLLEALKGLGYGAKLSGG